MNDLPEDRRFWTLATKWLQGRITPEERNAFVDWYNRQDDGEAVVIPEGVASSEEEHRERMLARIRAEMEPVGQVVSLRRRRVWWVAAAALVGVLAGGTWLWMERSRNVPVVPVMASVAKDVAPGHSGAVLTLAGGGRVVLDSAASAGIPVQGSVSVTNGKGQLAYKGAGGALVYNTLSTGRGNQYQVVLSDGTKVWLNAASSITYPVAFGAGERRVRVTGEAYFEVVHRADAPFVVEAGGREIRDVGTHFNVNAYPDEPYMATTLLEGAVRVGTVVLAPGEQARASSGSSIYVIKGVDLDLVVAWKNGMQSFEGADLYTILRQVRRWYDVDVEVRGTLPARKFSGDIPRTAPLSELLKLFTATGIHFTIDPSLRKLTVVP